MCKYDVEVMFWLWPVTCSLRFGLQNQNQINFVVVVVVGFCDQPEQYHVTVLDTEASERCLLAGDFTFLLDREAAFLLDKDTAAIIYRWPYMFLRRFGVLKVYRDWVP